MKRMTLLLLAGLLTACGPSETPKQANIPTVEELVSRIMREAEETIQQRLSGFVS